MRGHAAGAYSPHSKNPEGTMEDALMRTRGSPRAVDGSRGVDWWSEAWSLFMKNPGMWVVFGVIFLVMMVMLGFIPVLGGLASAVLTQVIVGGWMLSARKLESGGNLDPADLFSGFKDRLNPLLAVGGLALAATIVIVGAGAIFGAGGVAGLIAAGGRGSAGGMMAGLAGLLIAVVVMTVLGFVAAIALWFAPALVVFDDVAPLEALKQSWSASMRNMVPFLVYGVLWIIAAVVASIPLMLGWFVLMPLTLLSMYRAYVDIFETAERPAQA
jgi:hypothetical protein